MTPLIAAAILCTCSSVNDPVDSKPESKDPITPEMRESLAKIRKVNAGMKKEVLDPALDEFYKDLKRLDRKVFAPMAITELMRVASKDPRTRKALKEALADKLLEVNLGHALLIAAGDDPEPHIKVLIKNIGSDDAKTRRAALDAVRRCAADAQKVLPTLRKIIEDAKAPASDYVRAYRLVDDVPDHVLAYWAKTQIEAARLNPDEIKEFEADAFKDVTGTFKDFKITRKDLEGVLRDYYVVEKEHWLHGYSHVGLADRTGRIVLKNGKKVEWMVKPGGLAWLKFDDGKKVYLAESK
jgi:hypothetical protein